MIFNMVGGGAGGAGGGATLVVSSPTNVSVTVSKDDKSYTKNSGSLGSTIFKGLATGIWTVTISGNGQTATRTIEITADYAITIAFFSASINITYPANSTCVVKNSSGQTVASNSNTGTSTKTWTATVNATGTYTIAATATDGSGKSKSETVEITTEGQFESVTLGYNIVAFADGKYKDIGSMSNVTLEDNELVLDAVTTGSLCKWSFSDIPVDVTDFSTLYWDLRWENYNGQNAKYRSAGVGLSKTKTPVTTEAASVTDPKTQFVASKIITTYPYAQMVAIDISALSGEYYLAAYSTSWTNTGYSTSTILYSKEIRIE